MQFPDEADGQTSTKIPGVTCSAVQLRLAIDDVVQTVTFWVDGIAFEGRVEGSGPYWVGLPPLLRDGEPHRFRAEIETDRDILVVEQRIRSRYLFDLTIVGNDLVGWIRDAVYSDHQVALDLIVDGRQLERQVANRSSDQGDCGFLFTVPRDTSLAYREVALQIAGTGYSPFGDYLLGLRALSYAREYEAGATTGRLHDHVVLPAVLDAARRGTPVQLPTGAVRLTGSRNRRPGPPVIDVVIPVYRDLDVTIACVRSVIAGRRELPYNILVVNDSSPDIGMADALRGLAASGDILYLENPRNLGFTASVNIGVGAATGDVILLNSDTVVPNGWVDRLYFAAYSSETIGTVTPLSNNAGILSVPGESDASPALPFAADLATIDAAAERVNSGILVDLPTSHGYCMFIKRALFDAIGLFDAERFPRGYGEENDFSLRAAARGWRNVATCDLFVQHVGSVSFQREAGTLTAAHIKVINRDYPDYSERVGAFLHRDPLSGARNRLIKHFWPRGGLFLVSLALGGGVERHVAERASTLVGMGYDVFLVSGLPAAEGHGYRIRRWSRSESLRYPADEAGFADLLADLAELDPVSVEIHHVIDIADGLIDMLTDAGIPWTVTLHDFFYICPRVALLDDADNYCGAPAAVKCNACVGRGGVHGGLHSSLRPLAQDVEGWRSIWRARLASAESVAAPSESTAALYRKVLPDLPVVVSPHYVEGPVELVVRERPPERIRVAVIGGIGPQKGFARLAELAAFAERWAEDIEFVVVGYTYDDDRLSPYRNVRITGAYQADHIQSLLVSLRLDAALFLSRMPETFSYTLTEALSAGLPPVAVDLGAFGDRLRQTGVGVLVATNASNEEWIAAIRAAATQQLKPVAAIPVSLAAPPPPRARSAPRTDMIRLGRPPEGLYGDKWATPRVNWFLRAGSPITSLQLALWIPAGLAGQHVEVMVNGDPLGRFALHAEQQREIALTLDRPRRSAEIELRFDFEATLPGPDPRRRAALITGLQVIAGTRLAQLVGKRKTG